jgi:hypothetical protein
MQTDADLRELVLAAARQHADARGWKWLTPVEVTLTNNVPGDRRWTVKTNAFAVGMNTRIVVRERDLVVLEAGYLPR